MQSERLPLLIIDAFTAEPFRGNPAAVCLLEHPASERWMQQVAAEMNLSETSFVIRSGSQWLIRWFTPSVETDLCGHATLASAHALWETGLLDRHEPAVFDTRRSGQLRCVLDDSWITMDFPSRPAVPAVAPEGLVRALGCEPVWVGRSAYDFLVHVANPGIVRALEPDHSVLAKLPVRGVIVTALAEGGGFDFVSRFFAPGAGVAEDPVTGSAHCTLAPYWQPITGKSEMRGWQASRRGGEVRVRLRGDRVDLVGQSVTVMTGTIPEEASSNVALR